MESYHGFQAAIMFPFALAIWMLMGGTARLIAAFLDFLYSSVFKEVVLRGLQGEYGPTVDILLQSFMPVEYTLLYGLAAVNIAIAAQAIERFTWWKAAIVGIAAFAWPMALVSSVVR